MFSFSKIQETTNTQIHIDRVYGGFSTRVNVKVSINQDHSVNVQGGKHILLNAVNIQALLSAWTR